MTMHIDLTTPEKLEAFGNALGEQSRGGAFVDLGSVAKASGTYAGEVDMGAERKAVLTKKVELWHGLKIGQHVVRCYKKGVYGRIEDVVVCQVGYQPSFAKLLVQWEDGTSTEEHPEHLWKAKPPEAVS
jgi:hypothetical protein